MPGCATSPWCPAPTQTSQEKALLQVQELVGYTWAGSPSQHCHHSKLGSISRCPNFLGVLPPLLLSTAGTTLQLWVLAVAPSLPYGKWPAQAGGSFWKAKSVDLQPSWHGSTLRPCGQHDPSSLCPLCCLTHSGSFRAKLLAGFPSQGHQFCLSLVGNESAATKGGQSLHGMTGRDELFPLPSSP